MTGTDTPVPLLLPSPVASPTAVIEPLTVGITAVSTHDTSRRLPAYLAYETTGEGIGSITLTARGQDGQVVARYPIPLDAENIAFWDSAISYVHDGAENGGFVLTRRAENGQIVAAGEYQRAGEERTIEAELYFDGVLLQARQLPMQGRAAAINLPINAGDSFIFAESGLVLTINEAGELYVEEKGVDNGRYTLTITAENSAGETAEASTVFAVKQIPISISDTVYIDPYNAVAFQYPPDWTAPARDGNLIQTHTISESVAVMITIVYPLSTGSNALSLKQSALLHFGGVHRLFEEEIVLGERRGLRTVYGYESEDGERRIGVLLTAVDDQTGVIIDIEGLQLNQDEITEAASILQESWNFLPTRITVGE